LPGLTLHGHPCVWGFLSAYREREALLAEFFPRCATFQALHWFWKRKLSIIQSLEELIGGLKARLPFFPKKSFFLDTTFLAHRASQAL